MLLNRPRASALMEREGLAGLVTITPLNTYYLSGYWGLFNTPGGYDAAYCAVLPRDDSQPAALVVPGLEIRRLETTGGTWMPNVFAHTQADIGQRFADGTVRGTDYTGWPVRPNAALGDLEKRWVDIVQRLGSQMSADAFQALARALKAAGLDGARLGTDDPRIAGWLEAAGLTRIDCRYLPGLFNEIRLVKTAQEIELMTVAARANETALLAATWAMHEGATWNELEAIYLMEMLRQGGRGVYLMCGVGELPAGEVRRHEPVMFDALGHVARYHGDFGRCAVVGEPSAEHRRRHRAIKTGWEAAQEYLRPGVRYSELAAAVAAVVRREGIPDFREPLVHSLGLEHTDDPKPPGAQPQTRPDQMLCENMVVNVDMPHTEIGWGSVHMEDTVQITADGCRRLGVADFSLRVIEP
ncbi:MAG: M24 family metallopeptidase [Gammaproteobacteria bacterium]